MGIQGTHTIFLLFSFTYLQLQATTPPSLKCEMEGLFCPPTPCLTSPPPLPRSNARWRGLFGNHHHPFNATTIPHSLEHKMGGLFCPPLPPLLKPPHHLLPFVATTTPPSLEREMDGLFYPPTPHLTPPTPLPCSNVRRRGFFGNASLFNTTATSLTRMRDGWAFLPTTTRLTPLPWHSNASFLGNHYPSLTHSNAS